MFYIFQMNDGRWHVDAFTSSPASARVMAMTLGGFATKAEAEAKRHEMVTMWAEARTYATELTPAGEQTVIPGCERNLAPGKTQLDLFG